MSILRISKCFWVCNLVVLCLIVSSFYACTCRRLKFENNYSASLIRVLVQPGAFHDKVVQLQGYISLGDEITCEKDGGTDSVISDLICLHKNDFQHGIIGNTVYLLYDSCLGDNLTARTEGYGVIVGRFIDDGDLGAGGTLTDIRLIELNPSRSLPQGFSWRADE
jgi:hypothetical protein